MQALGAKTEHGAGPENWIGQNNEGTAVDFSNRLSLSFLFSSSAQRSTIHAPRCQLFPSRVLLLAIPPPIFFFHLVFHPSSHLPLPITAVCPCGANCLVCLITTQVV